MFQHFLPILAQVSFFVGFTRVVHTYAVSPNVGRKSFVATVWEAVLDRSEGRGPIEKVRRDFEERVDGSGCLVYVALLWVLLLAVWCLSSARRGPMRKALKGDDNVIAGCGIGKGRESMCQ